MRWHPLVMKWCLRLYNKSHSSYIALLVGEMNLSKSGEFGVTSFLSLWYMHSRVL